MSASRASRQRAITSTCDFFQVQELDGGGADLFAVRAGVPTSAAEAFVDVALSTAASLLDNSIGGEFGAGDGGAVVDADLVYACRILIELGNAVFKSIPSATNEQTA